MAMTCTTHAWSRLRERFAEPWARACFAGVAALAAVLAIAAFPAISRAEGEGSSAVMWGDNIEWQLSAGYRSNPGEFYPVTVQGLNNIKTIVPGEWFSLALLTDGTVRAWGGGNEAGQWGNGTHGTAGIVNGHYVTVKGLSGSEELTEVKSLAASGGHDMALLDNGTVAVWGSNEFGELGNGELNPRERYNPKTKEYEKSMQGTGKDEPVLVPGLSEVTMVAAGGGADYALKVKPGGEEELLAWGRDGNEKLGLGPVEPQPCKTEIGEVPCETAPHPVILPESVKDGSAHVVAIAAGGLSTAILLSDGTIWAWGNNGKGGLGTDAIQNKGKVSEITSTVPVQVELEHKNPGAKAIAVSAGSEHFAAVLEGGAVVGWGTDGQGQLGSTEPEICQTTKCFKVPTVIPGLSSITSVAGGAGFTLALNSEGDVFSLGRNKYGELGRELGIQPGTGKRVFSSDEPVEVHEPGPVTQIGASTVFGAALVAPGTTLPPQQLTIAAGEESLTPSWTFTDHEYLVRWARYEECPELTEEEEIALQEEGKEVECKKKEISPTQTLLEGQHTWEFKEIEHLQPTEMIVRSYDGIVERTIKETIEKEGKKEEIEKPVKEFVNEHLRFIWATPLPSKPDVTKVEPSIGRVDGGTTVTIDGKHLSGATSVKFGSVEASGFTVNSEGTSITAVSPAESAGVVDVTVTTAVGTSPTSSADRYTYAVQPPAVSSVSPSEGPNTGGTSVTITGENLGGATAVKFGTVEASSFTVNSEGTVITAVAPAGSAGTVDVRVTTPEGTSAPNPPGDQFTYYAVPTLTKIKPNTGPAGGGTVVTITGTNLSGATAVKFGSVEATSFTVNSEGTSITATAPAQPVETVDVRVTTPRGTTAIVNADQYKVFPTITGISPNHGRVAGGTPVVVTGEGFALGETATKIRFGTITKVTVNCVWTTECYVTSPAAKEAGTVDVKATVNNVVTTPVEADHFTYE
jgi:alpha-tubulin suppressor-like RCC1 family protein